MELTRVTGSGGHSINLTYGSSGLVSTVTNPSGQVTSYTYTAGTLSSVNGPTGTTSYEYNASHFLIKVTAPGGHVTTNVYDANGQVTAQTNRIEKTTNHTYTGSSFSSYRQGNDDHGSRGAC